MFTAISIPNHCHFSGISVTISPQILAFEDEERLKIISGEETMRINEIKLPMPQWPKTEVSVVQ